MNLFAYGTLMDPEIMCQVTGAVYRARKAFLNKYVRKTVVGEVFPAITKQIAGTVDGIVYFDITPQALERLDTFEGSLYVREKVMTICDNGENVGAFTYVISSDSRHLISDENWSYENFLATNKKLFLDEYPGYRDIEK